MRAVWLREHGGPGTLVLGEAPDPRAAEAHAAIEACDTVGKTLLEAALAEALRR